MTIDSSRCVTCLNCVESCKFGALTYTIAKPETRKLDFLSTCCAKKGAQPEGEDKDGMSRRSFMTIAGTMVAAQALEAQQGVTDGGLADIENKKIPVRNTPIVPPGAQSLRNMRRKCTACQLCVSACPNCVLRPSNKLATLMQPEMSFERGWCRVECVECSKVCPSTAIQKITPAEKTGISIGHAYWIKDNCIVHRDNVQCKACERNCPTGAITLVECNQHPDREHKVPVIDRTMCNGCGACEFFCPARPFSAIYVEWHERHQEI
jgi:ferredoxin